MHCFSQTRVTTPPDTSLKLPFDQVAQDDTASNAEKGYQETARFRNIHEAATNNSPSGVTPDSRFYRRHYLSTKTQPKRNTCKFQHYTCWHKPKALGKITTTYFSD